MFSVKKYVNEILYNIAITPLEFSSFGEKEEYWKITLALPLHCKIIATPCNQE